MRLFLNRPQVAFFLFSGGKRVVALPIEKSPQNTHTGFTRVFSHRYPTTVPSAEQGSDVPLDYLSSASIQEFRSTNSKNLHLLAYNYFAHKWRYFLFLSVEVSVPYRSEESRHIANNGFTRGIYHRCPKAVSQAEQGSDTPPDYPSSAEYTHCSFPSHRLYDAYFSR